LENLVRHKFAPRIVFCGFSLCAIGLPASQTPSPSFEKAEFSDTAASASRKDACVLLTTAEIQAVQGEPVKETKASIQPNGEMQISECLFVTTTFARSVGVALATPSTTRPNMHSPRKFWQRQFYAAGVNEGETRAGKKAEKQGEGGEETHKPRRIEGLGEDAYWVGTPITGALYVLHGDEFVRISVGGTSEESIRIEKSKILARAIMKRLQSHS
jgi:hypothetical protein